MRRLWFPLFIALAGACAASGDGGDSTPYDGGTKKDTGKDTSSIADEDTGTQSNDSGSKDTGPKDAGQKDTAVKDAAKPDTSAPDTGTLQLDASAPPGTSLTINEIDYDQLNLDTAEFVELFNPTASPIDVTGYQLVFYNGALNSVVEYLRIPLTGTVAAGGYLVVGAPGLAIDPGAAKIDFSAASNNIQNGDPDGIALFDTAGGKLDSASYGGVMLGISEGSGAAPVDSNSIAGSLIRSPNAADTNDNAADFKFTTSITAGKANVLVP